MGVGEIRELDEIASEITRSSGLPVSPRELERVLSALGEGSKDIWQLTAGSRVPFNVLVAAIRVLRDRNLVRIGSEIALTESAVNMFRLGLRVTDTVCSHCLGTGIDTSDFAEVMRKFEEIAAERPAPVAQYDQGYLTAESSMRRVVAIASRSDLSGKRLLVLGDDDLISIAAALTGLPKDVTVVEIDTRLTDFIEAVAKEYSLPVSTIALDLRLPLPQEFRRAFDTFITDPPDTAPGQILFLSRGISGLKGPGSAGYFGFTLVEANLHTWREVQSFLCGEARFVITEILPDFSRYENWPYLLETVDLSDLPELAHNPTSQWYRSTFYRIEALDDSVFDLDPGVAELPDEALYLSETSLIKPSRRGSR